MASQPPNHLPLVPQIRPVQAPPPPLDPSSFDTFDLGEPLVARPTPNMAPAPISPASSETIGPHRSYIEVAKTFRFQHQIDRETVSIGNTEDREIATRLQGVAHIDAVRRALNLPVSTYDTACVFFHRFRLNHPDSTFNSMDAAIAALFAAGKTEDTHKKSREILCAAYNIKAPPGEYLNIDDPFFDQPSRTVIGLERLMLESSNFDFRTHHPHKYIVKLHNTLHSQTPTNLCSVALDLSLDLNRTWASLKQDVFANAAACYELACRLERKENWRDGLLDDTNDNFYSRWNIEREEVVETLHDLLDLYTHHRRDSTVGPTYSIDDFLAARLDINNETSNSNYARHTGYSSAEPSAPATGQTDTTLAAPSTAPRSPGESQAGVGARGQTGTVRFMLDEERAARERAIVDAFFADEEEEVEMEVDEEIPLDGEDGHHGRDGGHHGRDGHHARDGHRGRARDGGGRRRR